MICGSRHGWLARPTSLNTPSSGGLLKHPFTASWGPCTPDCHALGRAASLGTSTIPACCLAANSGTSTPQPAWWHTPTLWWVLCHCRWKPRPLLARDGECRWWRDAGEQAVGCELAWGRQWLFQTRTQELWLKVDCWAQGQEAVTCDEICWAPLATEAVGAGLVIASACRSPPPLRDCQNGL